MKDALGIGLIIVAALALPACSGDRALGGRALQSGQPPLMAEYLTEYPQGELAGEVRAALAGAAAQAVKADPRFAELVTWRKRADALGFAFRPAGDAFAASLSRLADDLARAEEVDEAAVSNLEAAQSRLDEIDASEFTAAEISTVVPPALDRLRTTTREATERLLLQSGWPEDLLLFRNLAPRSYKPRAELLARNQIKRYIAAALEACAGMLKEGDSGRAEFLCLEGLAMVRFAVGQMPDLADWGARFEATLKNEEALVLTKTPVEGYRRGPAREVVGFWAERGRNCYERLLPLYEGFTASLAFRVSFGADGLVNDVEVTGARPLPDPSARLAHCYMRLLSLIKITGVPADGLALEVPLKFRPQQGG